MSNGQALTNLIIILVVFYFAAFFVAAEFAIVSVRKSALESALESFAGCAIIISHDRMFLDRLATHILAFEGDGHVEWFEGNFEDYEEDKVRRLGPDALNPGSQAYKRLTR